MRTCGLGFIDFSDIVCLGIQAWGQTIPRRAEPSPALSPLELGVNHGGPIHRQTYEQGISAQREYLQHWKGN